MDGDGLADIHRLRDALACLHAGVVTAGHLDGVSRVGRVHRRLDGSVVTAAGADVQCGVRIGGGISLGAAAAALPPLPTTHSTARASINARPRTNEIDSSLVFMGSSSSAWKSISRLSFLQRQSSSSYFGQVHKVVEDADRHLIPGGKKHVVTDLIPEPRRIESRMIRPAWISPPVVADVRRGAAEVLQARSGIVVNERCCAPNRRATAREPNPIPDVVRDGRARQGCVAVFERQSRASIVLDAPIRHGDLLPAVANRPWSAVLLPL